MSFDHIDINPENGKHHITGGGTSPKTVLNGLEAWEQPDYFTDSGPGRFVEEHILPKGVKRAGIGLGGLALLVGGLSILTSFTSEASEISQYQLQHPQVQYQSVNQQYINKSN